MPSKHKVCPNGCKTLTDKPRYMTSLYVKNNRSQMNKRGKPYTQVGWICDGCQVMVYDP